MIELTQGDILSANTEALVNTVNCVGVMGRGIALQFKKAFPDNFQAYAAACQARQVRPGKMFVHDLQSLEPPHWIINFPSKRHWRNKSRIEDIQAGLGDLLDIVQRHQISSIAIPPLGCGLGGLEWEAVRPLIFDAFECLAGVHVLLYEPIGAPPAAERVRDSQTPRMTPGRAALLSLMHRYLSAVMDPTITLLEVHKLMYFMQAVGEPLRLKYQKAPYGPYAENLRHVLNHIEGHFISGYGDAGDTPDKALELKSHAAAAAESFLAEHGATQVRLERVAQVIEGLETPLGLELLATVHWVVTQEQASTVAKAIAKVHGWSARKRELFNERVIRLVWQRLEECGLIVEET